MTTPSDPEAALKRALWLHIGRLVDDETLKLGVNATPQFIGSLAELVYAHVTNTGRDLEAFAQHGGRSRIDTRDVLLLGRRNEGLMQVLEARVEMLKKEKKGEQKGKV